jgi:hypothetical protein
VEWREQVEMGRELKENLRNKKIFSFRIEKPSLWIAGEIQAT